MKIFYNKNTNTFYDTRIHTYIPEGSIEISIEDHQQLFLGQTNGMMIQADHSGRPILVPRIHHDFTPEVVSMRQARLALHNAGLLNQVQQIIDNLPEPQKTTAQIEWEYSQDLKRNHPLIESIGAALNLSSTDIDNLFKQAHEL